MKRTYYKIDLELSSPLSLGSGLGENTDSDVLFDSRGKPFIPASSIAGVIRHSIADERTANALFGSIGDVAQKTQVIIYDAVCVCEHTAIAVRDSVRLNDKVAEDTGKFDFEAVETGARFVGYIELAEHDDVAEVVIFDALCKMELGLLRFGYKTSRGYGAVTITSCRKLAFTDVDSWLDFDMYDNDCWRGAEELELRRGLAESGVVKIILELKQRGAVSVRNYTTKASEDEIIAPDYEQLSLLNGTPVIPGTTWAGAFRERFCEFAGAEACKYLFGSIEKDSVNKKSLIYFGESQIKDFEYKTVTRNSIDRYTCGTNDGALYTERTVFNGTTELEIILAEKPSAESACALMAVIADLHNGFLAVGGLTSVGRGIFSVEHIFVNGTDVTDDLREYRFNKIAEVIAGV